MLVAFQIYGIFSVGVVNHCPGPGLPYLTPPPSHYIRIGMLTEFTLAIRKKVDKLLGSLRIRVRNEYIPFRVLDRA
jgi:hypothetical protein